jgi:hypothetical protein
LQLAWSRYFSDLAAETGNADLALSASKLANDSRQNLLAAFELCAREAKSKPLPPLLPTQPADDLADDDALPYDLSRTADPARDKK